MRVGKWFLWVIIGLLMYVVPVSAEAMGQDELLKIVVNLPSRTLELYQDEKVVKEYPVAIGKPSTPTPTGNFTIIDKEVNPWWYPSDKDYVVPSGPENPLGYRWMGIAPLYGIHGTNAPWSIGLAVSNGCIRMREEDVEELFEQVDYDTPVKVEYERVKVRIDVKGQASIGLYPDVYGRQRITMADVKGALAEADLAGLIDDVFLQTLLREIPDRQIVFAQLHNIKINGERRPERIVAWQGKKYVPVMALADSLKAHIDWDENSRTLLRQNQTVSGVKRGNTIYVAAQDLPALFGGREVWNDSENCLELILPVAKLDGQIISGDIQQIGETLAVPALAVAKALGERVKWRPGAAKLVLHGHSATVRVAGGQPFIDINDVGKIFNLAAVWNDRTQTIEMTYPLYPIDYSMYLDPDEEFF
ncbi:hypothetical protein SCACP_38140 [Sporomusa carbonis]|uniref:L,D-transpeptidase family protein n=1 Tax=Sporomusa carbonis TaxID=3076075 RepID=UPI003A6D926B